MPREKMRRLPLAKEIYRGVFPQAAPDGYRFTRIDWRRSPQPAERAQARILNVLNYTKTSGTAYAATRYPAGYHTIEVDGTTYAGQRQPAERLARIPLDMTGRTVLDIGCNQGGMLFGLGDAPRWAVGLDYDPRMINACNVIKGRMPQRDLGFYVFDIDSDPHGLIRDFLPEPRVDVVFLLSVCMWVERWRDLIDFIAEITDTLVFEANGSPEQQAEQIAYLRRDFSQIELLAARSDDDPSNPRRQLLIARR